MNSFCSDFVLIPQSWWSPPARNMSAPLKAKGKEKVTIGYGAGGGEDITFTLKDGMDSEIGFFKLFFYEIEAEMVVRDIEQESPLESHTFANETRNVGGLGWNGMFCCWGTKLVKVTVVRRK